LLQLRCHDELLAHLHLHFHLHCHKSSLSYFLRVMKIIFKIG
jgi:hypothetical protein